MGYLVSRHSECYLPLASSFMPLYSVRSLAKHQDRPDICRLERGGWERRGCLICGPEETEIETHVGNVRNPPAFRLPIIIGQLSPPPSSTTVRNLCIITPPIFLYPSQTTCPRPETVVLFEYLLALVFCRSLFYVLSVACSVESYPNTLSLPTSAGLMTAYDDARPLLTSLPTRPSRTR